MSAACALSAAVCSDNPNLTPGRMKSGVPDSRGRFAAQDGLVRAGLGGRLAGTAVAIDLNAGVFRTARVSPMHRPIVLHQQTHTTAPPQPGVAKRQILGIQYLRGIAALLVVLHHVRNPVPGMFNPVVDQTFGQRGVDIFFIISGFIMFTAARAEPVATFLWRRVVRVVPLYWAATLALAVIMVATGKFDRGHALVTILSLFFVPHLSLDVPGAVIPLLDPGWTLNYEMFFYGIFAVALWTRHVVATTCAIIVLLVMIGLVFHPGPAIGSTYTSTMLLEFLGGLLLAKLFHDRPVTWLGWLAIPGFICLVMIGDAGADRVIVAGLPALAIVAAAASSDFAGKTPVMPLLRRIGDASYSIYLSHYFVLRLAIAAWRHLPLHGWPQFICYAVAATIGSIAVGMLIHTFVEKPLNRILRSAGPLRRGHADRRGGETRA
jgi:exopolysaccharide production protein ExoZ